MTTDRKAGVGAVFVRVANTDDVIGIVRVHRSGFPGFLMTLLGPGFLRTYYRCALDYGGVIALVADEEGRGLRGFVVGFVRPSGFYAALRAKRWELATSALMHVAFRPTMWSRVLHDMREVRSRSGAGDDDCSVELASIAVERGISGKGIGAELVGKFIELARRSGAKRVVLTTDAIKNDAVNSFYAKLGFRLERTLSRSASRPMNEYVYELG